MRVLRTGLITIFLALGVEAFATGRSLLVPKELRRTNLMPSRTRGLASMAGTHYPKRTPVSPNVPVAPVAAAAAAMIDMRGILLRNAVTIPEAIFSPRPAKKPFVLPSVETVAEPTEFGAVSFAGKNPGSPNGGGAGGGGSGSGGGSPSGTPSGSSSGSPQNQDHGAGLQDPNSERELNGDRGGQRPIGLGDYFKEFPNQGDGMTVPLPGTRQPEGFAPVSSALIPAGTNGNPAWSYRSALPGGVYEGCQATLVSTQDNVCRAATAAHCVEDALKVYGGRFNPEVGMHEGVAHLTTADFGKVKAKIFLNSHYVNSGGNGGNDSALLAWPCDAATVKVPVVPFADDLRPLTNGQGMFYGKVMGGKEGLYSGEAEIRADVRINGVADGTSYLKMRQTQGKGIQQGDSGGPAFVGSPDNLRLYGVLSTRDVSPESQGNYTVGPAVMPVAIASRLSGKAFGFSVPEVPDSGTLLAGKN